MAGVSSVSCGSADNCAAGGYYQDSVGNYQAFVADQVNGTWGTAIEVPGTAVLEAAGGAAFVNSVSCASAGNCVAGGLYGNSKYASGVYGQRAFVADEVNGTWGNAIEVPGTAALATGEYAQVTSVSCASAGNCAAAGYYLDTLNHDHVFVVDEVNGTWGTAEEIPGSATLNAGNFARVSALSCASAGNCAVGGRYYDSAGIQQAFVADEVNGTWHTAIRVPGTTATTGQTATVNSVSCGSAGNCVAGGYYPDSSGLDQAFVVDEVNGTWHTAIEVPGTAALNMGDATVSSVSCVSAGNCAAGGSYGDTPYHLQVFVVSEVNGTWGTAIEVPGSAALNTAGYAEINSVSCGSAGNCAAGGYYTYSTSYTQAFVVSEVNGTWGTAIEVPGSAALNTGGGATVTSVSCGSAANCAAGGHYEDLHTDNSHKFQAFVVSQQ